MKTTIFYFAGRAGDLPTALLRHATVNLATDNQKRAKLLASPLRTIKLLTAAVTAVDRLGGRGNAIYRSNMEALKRPPMVLSGKAFEKCKTCGGMGYLAQLDAHGENIDTVECPQCHPAYSNNQ